MRSEDILDRDKEKDRSGRIGENWSDLHDEHPCNPVGWKVVPPKEGWSYWPEGNLRTCKSGYVVVG